MKKRGKYEEDRPPTMLKRPLKMPTRLQLKSKKRQHVDSDDEVWMERKHNEIGEAEYGYSVS